MKTSKRRKLASRANGALSKGPKTDEGKAHSSLNAVRHGMLAKTVLLQNEHPEVFKELYFAFIDRFKPTDEVERGLVEEMVLCHWRIRRGWAVETELWNRQIDGQPLAPDAQAEIGRMAVAFIDLANTPQLGLLNRYESRLHRMFHRALQTLQSLRETKPPTEGKSETPAEPIFDPTVESPVDTKADTLTDLPKLQIRETNLIPKSDASELASSTHPTPLLTLVLPRS